MSTDRREDLGRALRDAREALGLDGQAFCEFVRQVAGRSLTTARLWAIERGEQRATEIWPDLVAALASAGADPDHLTGIEELQFREEPVPSPVRNLADRVADLRASAEDAAACAEDLDEADHTERAAFGRRLAVLTRSVVAAGTGLPGPPDPRDRVEVLAPTRELRASPNELFAIAVRLRNAGPVPWRERFLLRLGPPVTSTISYTPPLIALPATPPHGITEIDLPGRAHYLPGTCVVTYVIVNAAGRPLLPGGLSLRITVVGDAHTAPTPDKAWRRALRGARRGLRGSTG